MLQLRNRAQAEDAVQETLIAALQGAKNFAGKSSVRTWLVGILKHKIVDHIRRARREEPLDLPNAEMSLPEAVEPPECIRVGVESAAEADQRIALMNCEALRRARNLADRWR